MSASTQISASPPSTAERNAGVASSGDTMQGFLFALMAYGIWGGLPIYLKATADIPTLEVLSHRVIWSVPIALGFLSLMGRTADLRRALCQPKTMMMAGLTAALISVNWGLYVYAMQTGQALQAALGYYINPLVSIAFAAIFLGEKLSKLQWGAVALAALAVAILTLSGGEVPLLALGMTMTWAFYALFKRALPVGPNQGFALEVLILLPFAVAWLVYRGASGDAIIWQRPGGEVALLLGCGVVTAVPLMIYANGAKMLRLSTIGLMQYITPTMVFFLAVFWFGEPFGGVQMIVFPMIWVAMLIYMTSILMQARKAG